MIVDNDTRFKLNKPNKVQFSLGHIDDLNRLEALGGVEVKTFLLPNGTIVVIPIDEFNKKAVLDSDIYNDGEKITLTKDYYYENNSKVEDYEIVQNHDIKMT